MKLNEKQKQSIGAYIVIGILIAYGFILGYVTRMSHEIDEETKEIERTNEDLRKKITKIRKDGFFVDEDDFE